MGGSASKSTPECNHNYYLKSDARTVATCNGCYLDAYGPRFVCKLCDKTLHKVCRYTEQSISHDFFDNSCVFTFNEGSLGEVPCKLCVGCGKEVRGFNYHCASKNLTLHPICYKLDKKVIIDDKIFSLRNKLVSNCLGCDKIYANARWAYVSTNNTTNFHVHCLNEYEFNMNNGGTRSSVPPANKVEMSDFDLSSLFESKIKSAKLSNLPTVATEHQLFMEYLTSDNHQKVEEGDTTTTSEPAEMGTFRRISEFFKTMYHKVESGITLTCQKVLNAARSFYFHIKSWWCEKIVGFFEGVVRLLSKAMLLHVKECCSVFGPDKLAELLHELAKASNLDITLEQCLKFLKFLQDISRGSVPQTFA